METQKNIGGYMDAPPTTYKKYTTDGHKRTNTPYIDFRAKTVSHELAPRLPYKELPTTERIVVGIMEEVREAHQTPAVISIMAQTDRKSVV